MNWWKSLKISAHKYSAEGLIEGKQPWELTSDEFMKHHNTGFIGSRAYKQYETSEGINFVRPEDYPEHYATVNFGGIDVEIRRDNKPNKYVAHDENDEILRDSQGHAVYLTPEQVKEKGYASVDGGLAAFVNGVPVGYASNEFGSTGVWVVKNMQGKGLGKYLLKEFRKTHDTIGNNEIGQMTEGGYNLTKSYHKSLVNDAYNDGKAIPDQVMQEYGLKPKNDLNENKVVSSIKSINWFNLYKLSFMKLANEYWIDDSGSAMFADGDIGDYNHEGYVQSVLLSQYGFDWESDGVDIHNPDFPSEWVSNNFEEAKDYYVKQGKWTPQWQQMEDNGDIAELVKEMGYWMANSTIFELSGASPEEAEIMTGGGDAREFAKKNWGWARVEGKNIEVYQISPGMMKTLASGYAEAFSLEPEDDMEVTIYCSIDDSWYTDVPLSVLDTGDIKKLLPYSNRKRGVQIQDVINPNDQQKTFNPYRQYTGD